MLLTKHSQSGVWEMLCIQACKFLSFAQEFYVKKEGGIRVDDPTSAPLAIPQLGWNDQLPLATLLQSTMELHLWTIDWPMGIC